MTDKNRKIFEKSALTLFVLAGVLRYIDSEEISLSFNLIKDISVISLFATSGAFIISMGVEAMLGTLEIVRKEQRRKGRQEGRQEMQREILQWIETEKEGGTRFQNDPPFGIDLDHK
ncbi:MAG: hypothetical protein OXU79_08545 [Gemmatimonadota bacterium]|nr:hypothetical protein [Gemmatimonadota bacterium]